MISRSRERQHRDRILRDPARVAAVERLDAVAGDALDRIAELLRATLEVDSAAVNLVGAIEGGICPLVVASQEPVLIADVWAEHRLANPAALEALGIAAYAGVPLRDAAGIVVGTVCAITRTPRAWSARDRALLEQFAAFTSFELERGFDGPSVEIDRVRSELSNTQLLQSISAAMIREENIDELYKMFVDAAVKIMRSDCGSMQMFVPERGESGELLLLASEGLDEQARSYWKWVSVDAGSSCGQALRTRSRVIVEDYRECSFALRRNDLEAFLAAGILAAQTTPLYSRTGQLFGMISTHWNRPHRPSELDLRMFDILARQAADLLERRFAVKALSESELRLRAFVETSSDVMYRMNADWSEIHSLGGRDFIADTSAPNREWIGEYIHPDDQSNVLARITEAISNKSTFDFEHRVIRADGTLGWTHSRAIPLLDEHGEIAEWFGTATDATFKKQAETQQKEALRESHRMIETLQTAFLPQTLPRVPGLRFDAAYLAAEEGALVGGDWYDAAVLPDGRILLCVGDVTGHGLSAAVTAGKLRQAATVAALTISDPTEVLDLLNRVLRFQQPEIYATAMLAFIDRDRTELTYANAGHPAAFLADRDGATVTELNRGGLPLGVEENLHAQTHRVALPAHFALALYSDGLTEFARDISSAEGAIKRVMSSLVAEPAMQPTAAAILGGVLGDMRPPDDVMVLLAMREAPPKMAWSFHSSDQAAARDVRSGLERVTRALQANDDASFAAQIVLGEALGNAVRHAPGLIDVNIECPDGALVITVRDRGPGVNDGARRLPRNMMDENGRGLFLMQALAASLSVRPWSGGTEMRAVLSLEKRASS